MARRLAALFDIAQPLVRPRRFRRPVWSWSSSHARGGLQRAAPSCRGLALLSIPLIVVIAKFPMVLDSGDGGIEVGFDSSILMFLLCTLNPHEALVIWSLGVLTTQLTTDKRPMVKLFNVGVGILGGAGLRLRARRGPWRQRRQGEPRRAPRGRLRGRLRTSP